MTFSQYAHFYDLLYCSKNYKFEFENLVKRIPQDGIKNVLELGCGTGKYSSLAAKLFEDVTAVDLSPDMIRLAKTKNNKPNIQYLVSDIRLLDLDETYDLIFSLFHVFSYLTSKTALNEAVAAAASCLRQGSYFCFDVWSSAGLVKNNLEMRRKEVGNKVGDKIIRYSYSIHNAQEENVLVNFDFIVLENSKDPKFFQEQHLMKYWSREIICEVAMNHGLKVIDTFDLHTGKNVSNDSFGATYLFEKL